jgi:hypothetical protein
MTVSAIMAAMGVVSTTVTSVVCGALDQVPLMRNWKRPQTTLATVVETPSMMAASICVTVQSKRDLDAHCLSMAELITCMRSAGPCVSTAHCVVTA